jgi:hypothetical protein
MSETSSDDETEFVEVEETPVLKTIKNAKGRKAGLALAREKHTAQRRAVKNVMEAHKAVEKVKQISQKVGTAQTVLKQKAMKAGIALPETTTENQMGEMLEAMRSEIESLRAMRETAPPKLEIIEEPEKPKKKVVKKKAPKPKPIELDIPKNEIVYEPPPAPAPLSHREQMFRQKQEEQQKKMDFLREALGRKY